MRCESKKSVMHLSGNVGLVILHRPVSRLPYAKLDNYTVKDGPCCLQRRGGQVMKEESEIWRRHRIWLKLLAELGSTTDCSPPSPEARDHSTAEIHGSSPEIQHAILNVSLTFLLWPHTVPSKSQKGNSELNSEAAKDRVGRRWRKTCRRDA